MESSSKTKPFLCHNTRSEKNPVKRGFQRHSNVSQKKTEAPPSIFSAQKKTIKKMPKLHTPATKTANSSTLSHSVHKMSSNHKKRLDFEQEAATPKKSTNSPNDLQAKSHQIAVIQRREPKIAIEEANMKDQKRGLMVRKLEFNMPEDKFMKEEAIFSIKISKEVEGQTVKKIKTEIKIETETPENQWFFNRAFKASPENPNSSRVTLNTFNSFKLSDENELIDLMDSQLQMQIQQKASDEIKRKFASKDYLSLMKDDQKSDEYSKKICCNCKKSRCLKLYCECFAAQKYCQDCNCTNCANLKSYQEEREKVIVSLLSRNPSAFKPKLEYEESQIISTQMAVKHAKGCNCKKTQCSKKYCECFQAGIKCSELCKCEDCRNCDYSHIPHYHQNFTMQQKNFFNLPQAKHENFLGRIEKEKNIFTGFVKNNSNLQHNNKIKIGLFNTVDEKMKESRFLREKFGPSPLLKLEERS